MSEKEIMSEEAMNELINGFEIVGSLTEYGRKNIKYHFQRLQEENQVMLSYCGLIAQQKEFIKWLEDESKKIYRDGGLRQNIYKEVLNKMQELEGSDSNE